MRKFALVIGVDHYSDERLARLSAPGRDAAVLADVLRSPEHGGFDHVETLLDADEKTIRLAVAGFVEQRVPDDLVLLYFSGHGVLDVYGKLYFAATDTNLSLLSATAIADTFVRERLDQTHARSQLLVLDCCHSGAFARGTKAALGASIGTAEKFAGEGYGRMVLTASDATQYAWDGDSVSGQAEHSLFTQFLIEGLKTGDADATGKGFITVDDVYAYVLGRVPPSRQRPLRFGEKQCGSLVLARNATPKPAALPADVRESVDDRRPWVRKGAIEELARLLEGPHTGIALAAAEALARLANADDSSEIRQAAAQALTSRGAASASPVASTVSPERVLSPIAGERIVVLPAAPVLPVPLPPPAARPVARPPRAVRAVTLPRPDRAPAVPMTRGRLALAVAPSLLLLAVFLVNIVETWAESRGTPTLDDRALTAAMTMNWFEQIISPRITFQNHDVASSVATLGYSIVYFFVFPFLSIAIAIAAARRPNGEPYRVFAVALAVDYFISFWFFLFFPVPERWAFPESGAILLSDLWSSEFIAMLRPMSALDNCFPSFHVSMSVIGALVCYVYEMRWRTVVAALAAMVALSTFVLGIHWIPDILSGIAVAAISVAISRRACTWWTNRAPKPRTAAQEVGPAEGGVSAASWPPVKASF